MYIYIFIYLHRKFSICLHHTFWSWSCPSSSADPLDHRLHHGKNRTKVPGDRHPCNLSPARTRPENSPLKTPGRPKMMGLGKPRPNSHFKKWRHFPHVRFLRCVKKYHQPMDFSGLFTRARLQRSVPVWMSGIWTWYVCISLQLIQKHVDSTNNAYTLVTTGVVVSRSCKLMIHKARSTVWWPTGERNPC